MILLSLQSCGSKQSIPDTSIPTPIEHIEQKVPTETGSIMSRSATGNIQSFSGAATTATQSMMPIRTSSGASKGVREIITLQKEKGQAAILNIDCMKLDPEGRSFCLNQKKAMEEIAESNITWENTLKRGPEYIKTFDCMKIFSEYGQKYCAEYKALLK